MNLYDIKRLGQACFFFNDYIIGCKMPPHCIEEGFVVTQYLNFLKFNGKRRRIDVLIFPQEIPLSNLKEIISHFYNEYQKHNPYADKKDFLKQILKYSREFEDVISETFVPHGMWGEYDFFRVQNEYKFGDIFCFHESKPLEYFQSYFKRVKSFFDEFSQKNEENQNNETIPKPWRNDFTEELYNYLISIEKSYNPKVELKKASYDRVFKVLYTKSTKLNETLSYTPYITWYKQDYSIKEGQSTVNIRSHKFLKLEKEALNFINNKIIDS
jgi:hypothetical protein